jgi:hypothetical protein
MNLNPKAKSETRASFGFSDGQWWPTVADFSPVVLVIILPRKDCHSSLLSSKKVKKRKITY